MNFSKIDDAHRSNVHRTIHKTFARDNNSNTFSLPSTSVKRLSVYTVSFTILVECMKRNETTDVLIELLKSREKIQEYDRTGIHFFLYFFPLSFMISLFLSLAFPLSRLIFYKIGVKK